MASQEDYYSSSFSPRPRPQSYSSSDPAAPPPPPKSTFSPDQNQAYQPQTPPSGLPFQSTSYTQGQTTASPRPQPPLPSSSQNLPPSLQFQAQALPEIIPPPPLSAAWLPDSLPQKSTTELAPILQNPALLNALAQTHPSYASSIDQLSAAIDNNLSLSSQLTQLESQLQQKRAEAGQLLLQHTTLSTQWRRKQTEMDDALSPWGPRAMYQRLVSSINEQEALLRALQESFLEGGDEDEGHDGVGKGKSSEKEVNEWIRRIREGTTVLEKRREMRARWDEGRVGGWR